MTAKSLVGSCLSTPVLFAVLALSIGGCRKTEAHPQDHTVNNGQPTPLEEHKKIFDYLVASGDAPRAFATPIRQGTNALFEELFRSVLKIKPDFKCYRGGCVQETVVPDLATVVKLDAAMLAPGSALLGVPVTIHRSPPIKLSEDGGLKVTWTVFLSEKEYPTLVDTANELPARRSHKPTEIK